MNIKLFTILICLTVCLLNCKKTEEGFSNPVDLKLLVYLPDSSLCTAIKEVPELGEVAWTANSFAQKLNDNLVFTFLTYQDSINLEVREILGMANIPFQKGNHKLGSNNAFPFCNYARAVADGDVIDATWEIDTEENNYIEISELDDENHFVSGKFDVYFKIRRQGLFELHSERINFRSGSFTAKIGQ